MKNQGFSSPRHRRARAAHLQERIPFNGFYGRRRARGRRRGEKGGTLRDAWEPMRSGACPTTPKPSPCRPRRRRKPHQALAIITIGREIGLVPLENHNASHPRGRASARTEGERRRPRQRPPAPGPLIFAIPLEPGGPRCGGAGICVCIEPLPLLLSSLRHGRTKQQEHVSNQPQTHARPGGRRIPLPAAAAAAS